MRIHAGKIPLLLFILFTAKKAICCTCNESYLENHKYDFIASGKIISKSTLKYYNFREYTIGENKKISPNYNSDFHYHSYRFVIERKILGQTTKDTIDIMTGEGGGDCGYDFKVGHKYIVYGNSRCNLHAGNSEKNIMEGANIFWTNECDRTKEFDDYYFLREEIELSKNNPEYAKRNIPQIWVEAKCLEGNFSDIIKSRLSKKELRKLPFVIDLYINKNGVAILDQINLLNKKGKNSQNESESIINELDSLLQNIKFSP